MKFDGYCDTYNGGNGFEYDICPRVKKLLYHELPFE